MKTPYFRRSEITGSQRTGACPSSAGLVLGGLLSAATSGGWAPFWDLGMFDAAFGWGPPGKLAWMFAGGLLIGFGTRMAGGCTSGHGIFGIANLERASLESTLAFMAAGIVDLEPDLPRGSRVTLNGALYLLFGTAFGWVLLAQRRRRLRRRPGHVPVHELPALRDHRYGASR